MQKTKDIKNNFNLYKTKRTLSRVSYSTSNLLLSQVVSNQVPSACECLTTVFGMGTGGTIQVSSLDFYSIEGCTFKTIQKQFFRHFRLRFKLSPRLISTGPLHSSPNFHSQPINLVVYKESYQLTL